MKIVFQPQSTHWDTEKNNQYYDSPITVDWKLPFFPTKGDVIDWWVISEDHDFRELSWEVDSVTVWSKDEDGTIFPIISIAGG